MHGHAKTLSSHRCLHFGFVASPMDLDFFVASYFSRVQTPFLQEQIVMQTDSFSSDSFSWELGRLAVNSAEIARPDVTRPFFNKLLPACNRQLPMGGCQ